MVRAVYGWKTSSKGGQMANSAKRSEKGKKGYLRYKQENRMVKNKLRRLRRLHAQHPNDRTNPFHPECKKKPDYMVQGV